MSAARNQERLLTVLLGPHVSEKTSRVADSDNQVVFRVRKDATKAEVRRAVEMLFDVQVTGVQVVNCRGKIKRFGQDFGQRRAWKKAYVSLAEGQDIDFVGASD
jgi:large subunit ribosomal protein L23